MSIVQMSAFSSGNSATMVVWLAFMGESMSTSSTATGNSMTSFWNLYRADEREKERVNQ